MKKNEVEVMKSINNCCGSTVKEITSVIGESVNDLPIVVIGAGPVGLAAAAHLADQGQKYILLESGSTVGSNIIEWGHVQLFSPWQYNIDKVAKKLLEKSGWNSPSAEKLPTGKELVEKYLEPLSKLPEIEQSLKLNSKVVSISKKGLDKMKDAGREQTSFVLYVEQQGNSKRIEAKAVIDATGTWGNPNPVNADNIWTLEERSLHKHIYYGIPDIQGKNREKYIGKRVAVVGGGHSAINTILELSQLGKDVEIYWIMRKKKVEDAYGGEEKDALEARGRLGSRIHQLVDDGQLQVFTPFKIHQLTHTNDGIELTGEYKNKEFNLTKIDEIITNTGSRPDFSFLREIRINIDAATESVEALSPLIDPNLHSCGTVRPHGEEILRQPEKNFYIVGMKSYGRAPTFLMATGYEQIRSIVAYLSGDVEASKKVELELPETGVCSINLVSENQTSTCCSKC
ncbi:NAD(P)-binding domain-containing protein [Lysinibacillus irui]|uniref:NAD(P)-binding domain-containing protein n=1 Tax=Lysinibacillus irui TaxID=2998077 RepID=A0ABU5NHU8_9BACI|nr:NAD(P)-binding domain-containing protein [Lysinibacillus irui]MEA0552983.1 NAD(P)-binding domain-containing protein [Lysinibacillus irui]MEA0975563.1 NAD(P)-binding domain-containing protein [Lysinibacillus irui]MEA1041717.1 NAD(P)-binding domain-containing protein [Lysinibacillus irui]